MFAPAIRSHFMALALTALVTLACLGAVYTAWLMPDDSLGVATAPLARLQSLFDGSASVPADPPLETFLPGQRQNLTPAQAVMANLASPLARINPPPPAFNPAWLAPTDLAAATECMARAIYYEANGEPAAGQLAVAQVILNRVRHPRFPKTVCGVVNQGSDRQTGCQFTFTCDGSLSRPANLAGMARARGVASAALHGAVSYAAGQATHYHTIWIVPVWAHEMNKVAIVGHHVFYRPPGNYGGWPVFAGGKGPAAEAVLAAPVIAPAALGANGDGVTISPTIAAAPAAGRQPASPPRIGRGWLSAFVHHCGDWCGCRAGPRDRSHIACANVRRCAPTPGLVGASFAIALAVHAARPFSNRLCCSAQCRSCCGKWGKVRSGPIPRIHVVKTTVSGVYGV